MTDAAPPGLLDLPVELRLMIFDLLPVKTTRHAIDFDDTAWNDRTPLQLVWKTYNAVTLLAVCRQLNTEVKALIACKLGGIKKEPVRLLVMMQGLYNIRFHRKLLDCIVLSGAASLNHDDDLRVALQSKGKHFRSRVQNAINTRHGTWRSVEIVVQWSPIRANQPMDSRRTWMDSTVGVFRDNLVRSLLKNEGVRNAIRVQFRLLETRPQESVLVESSTHIEREKLEQKLTWAVRLGDVMGMEEWKEHWEEHEDLI